ncbi:MAG: tetratricopeptide repeat protein [Bacteroidales bacterium]|nr:tetratricopeptide repeat protein [Bacteroidales bacterium]
MTKNILILIFILLPWFTLKSQSIAEIDTTIVLDYINKANRSLKNQQADSAYIYANKAIKYSREYSYRKGKADAYLIIAQLEERKENLPVALRYYFGSVREYEMINDYLSSAKVRIKIGEIYQEGGLYEKALEYYLDAEKSLILKGKEKDVNLLENIASIYYDLRNFEKSLFYYQRLEKIYDRKNDRQAVLNTFYSIVKCYNNLDLPEKSLEYNLKILEHFRNSGNKEQELITLNNIGYSYKNQKNYEEALNFFKQSLTLEKELKDFDNPATLINIAIIYQNTDEYKNALEYMIKAEKIVERSGDKAEMAKTDHLTSVVYYSNKDYHNAQVYNHEALRLAKEVGDAETLESALLVSSKIYQALYDYENAMTDYKKYLFLKDSLESAKQAKQSKLNEQQFVIERTEKEIEMLLANEDLKDLEYQRVKLENETKEQQIEIFRQNDSIQKITIKNQNLEKDRALQEKLLAEERLDAEIKDREIEDLKQIEQIQALELERQELVQKEQENEIVLLNKENEISELNLKKVKTRNKFLFGISALALLIMYLVYRGLRFAKKTNKILVKQNNEIERQRDEIDHERKRSDKLLLNILPEETAEELKEKGAATPKHYEMVSVLFTDFVGFTNIAEKLTPQELVKELDKCFLEFDKIIDRHNLEKIKTIGDAYMCAGGIPVANATNPYDIVHAGLEIKKFMEKLKSEKEAVGEKFWELRIGIHTGQVIAGVVGKNKFAYDIWGDAVNTASRMESSGVPGKVNISGETYELVKDKFSCTYRGKVKAKNKGEIDMYIVEGLQII